MPWLAPMLSVKTRAMTEMPAEKRRPVMMEGIARARQRGGPVAIPARRSFGRPRHPPVDVSHAVGRVEVHGEQRGEGDEEHVGRLADPEPHNEQEDQRRIGHRPEHLHRRVQELLAQTGQPHDDAQDQSDAGTEGEAQHRAAKWTHPRRPQDPGAAGAGRTRPRWHRGSRASSMG